MWELAQALAIVFGILAVGGIAIVFISVKLLEWIYD